MDGVDERNVSEGEVNDDDEEDDDGSSIENGSSVDDGALVQRGDDAPNDATPTAPWTEFVAAIQAGASLESIRTLVSGWEDTIFCKPHEPTQPSYYALHCAASSRNVSPQVLQYIIDAHPPALQIRDRYGHLPLHCAILNRLQVPQVRVLVEAWKPSLRKFTSSGFLPLHLTVRDRDMERSSLAWDTRSRTHDSSLVISSLPVVKYLIDEWSDALIKPSTNRTSSISDGGDDGGSGVLPIHLAVITVAAIYDDDPELARVLPIVQCLIDPRPETLRVPSNDGRIALHMAINYLAAIPVLELLVKHEPASIRIPTLTGYLPLHLAFVRHDGSVYGGAGVRPPDVVKFLVDCWPGALRVPEPLNGYLPAHLALAPEDLELHEDNGSQSVYDLLEAWPGAARAKSSNGYTVLHCAATAGESLDVIQRIVSYNPMAVRVKCNQGRLPIHQFLLMWSSQRDRYDYDDDKEASALSVIRYFLEQWPESTMEKDESGELPIHLACESNMSQEVLECLIRQSPGSLLERKGSDGHIPLHILASQRVPQLPAIQLLVQHSSRSLREKAAMNGDLALHMVIASSQDPATIQFMIRNYPEALREVNGEGHLPIHVAIESGASLALLRTIFDPWRDAARVAALDGYLPAHLAAEHGAPLEFLRDLINAYPPSVRALTGQGWLPIHCAALSHEPSPSARTYRLRPTVQEAATGPEWPPPDDYPFTSRDPSPLIDLLLEKWPDSLIETTPDKWTLLHLLCRNTMTPARLIDRLCGMHPSMISAATAEGYVHLHVALMNGLPSDAIHQLFLLWPGAVRAATSTNWIPLHFAMAHGAPEDQVRLLVNEWPDSVDARTMDDDRLALHVGAAGKASTASLQIVLSHRPQSVHAISRGGLLAVHLAAQRDATDRTADSVVRFLMDLWPESIDAATDEGFLPVHFAVARNTVFSLWSFGRRIDVVGMVERLADARPESLVAATRTGRVPLHCAASDAASVDVVRLLVRRRPETALAQTHDGETPLHLASSALRRDVVRCLLARSPPNESVRAVDNRGRLPLHAAVDRSFDTSPNVDFQMLMGTTEALVEAWPESVRQLDHRNRLPLHLAALSDCPESLLFYLLKAYPESISRSAREPSVAVGGSHGHDDPPRRPRDDDAAGPSSSPVRKKRASSPVPT